MVSLPYTDVPGDWTMAGCPGHSSSTRPTAGPPPSSCAGNRKRRRRCLPSAPAYLERIVRKLSGNLDTAVVPSTASRRMKRRRTISPSGSPCCFRQRGRSPVSASPAARAAERPGSRSKRPNAQQTGQAGGPFCYNKGLGQYLQDRVATGARPSPYSPASSTNTCAG